MRQDSIVARIAANCASTSSGDAAPREKTVIDSMNAIISLRARSASKEVRTGAETFSVCTEQALASRPGGEQLVNNGMPADTANHK